MTLSLLEPKEAQLGKHLALTYWSAYDVPAHGMESGIPRVFVGLLKGHDRMAWVSEPIYRFDPLEATGRTCEGRTYRLEGMPGYNAAVNQAWTVWKRTHGVRDAIDAGEEVLESILLAHRMAQSADLRRLGMKARS